MDAGPWDMYHHISHLSTCQGMQGEHAVSPKILPRHAFRTIRNLDKQHLSAPLKPTPPLHILFLPPSKPRNSVQTHLPIHPSSHPPKSPTRFICTAQYMHAVHLPLSIISCRPKQPQNKDRMADTLSCDRRIHSPPYLSCVKSGAES
jgi:hypothetical protein